MVKEKRSLALTHPKYFILLILASRNVMLGRVNEKVGKITEK